jgi:transcriptional regulator with XRE-family HTH domain
VSNPDHGTAHRYDHGTDTEPPCREDCCRRAKNMARYRQERLRAAGGSVFTDPAPVAAHVAALRAAGLGPRQIAARAGVGVYTVRRVAVQHYVRVDTAARILAVRPDGPTVAAEANCHVSALGSRRRVHALLLAGWTLAQIAREAEVNRHMVESIHRGDRAVVTVRTAQRISAVTTALWERRPPRRTRAERRNITYSQGLAARYGAVPLAAWDDIDDPADTPKGVPPARRAA